MMKCKNCKYWTETELMEYEKKNGTKIHGECSNKKFTYNVNNPRVSDGLEYWDMESYSAGFSTGPEFGCINHKGATPPPAKDWLKDHPETEKIVKEGLKKSKLRQIDEI